MSNHDRPLSPHLSVYRWPVTMVSSILHRGTGIANAVGLVVLAWWLTAIAGGAADYAQFAGFMSTLVGRLLLVGWSFSFFYHLANGVRHLFWDAGYGFEKSQAVASAWTVLVLAVIATAVFWGLVA